MDEEPSLILKNTSLCQLIVAVVKKICYKRPYHNRESNRCSRDTTLTDDTAPSQTYKYTFDITRNQLVLKIFSKNYF